MPGSPYTDSQLREQIATNEIGGGQPYLNTLTATEQITEADCDTTVSTGSGFWSAVKGSANSIWIADGASINISGNSGYCDAIIAGNRGVNGSDGPLIYSTDRGTDSHAYQGGTGYGHLTLQSGARITGVQLRGWAHDYWDNPEHPGYIPLSDSSQRATEYARAISIHTSNAEVDNVELYGFCTQGLTVGTSSSAYDPHIHHNDLHDNMQTAFGYHIEVFRGKPVIEYNYMNAHRHAIAGFGPYNSAYICRYNLFGPSVSSHEIDAHSQANNSSGTTSDYYSQGYYGGAGGNMEIYRNTHTATHVISDANFDAGKWTWAISMRGSPWPRDTNGVQIYDNVFEHPEVTENGGGSGIRDQSHNGPYNQQLSRSSSPSFSHPSSEIGADRFTLNYEHGPNTFNGSTTTYDSTQVGAPINLEGPDPDQPPETAELRVYPRAEEAGGTPVEGALITIDPHEDISEWYDEAYEKTAEYQAEYDGVYAIWGSLPVGTYDIYAEHPDYATATYADLYLDSSGRQPIIVMDPLQDVASYSPLTITVYGNAAALDTAQDVGFSIGSSESNATDDGDQ